MLFLNQFLYSTPFRQKNTSFVAKNQKILYNRRESDIGKMGGDSMKEQKNPKKKERNLSIWFTAAVLVLVYLILAKVY